MTAKLPEDNRHALTPDRTYSVPGGPLARDLGETEVYKLAEIVRGGEGDSGFGSRRSSSLGDG